MTIHIRCEACGASFNVPEAMAGRSGKCRCGRTVEVPRPDEAAPPPEDALPRFTFDVPTPPTRTAVAEPGAAVASLAAPVAPLGTPATPSAVPARPPATHSTAGEVECVQCGMMSRPGAECEWCHQPLGVIRPPVLDEGSPEPVEGEAAAAGLTGKMNPGAALVEALQVVFGNAFSVLGGGVLVAVLCLCVWWGYSKVATRIVVHHFQAMAASGARGNPFAVQPTRSSGSGRTTGGGWGRQVSQFVAQVPPLRAMVPLAAALGGAVNTILFLALAVVLFLSPLQLGPQYVMIQRLGRGETSAGALFLGYRSFLPIAGGTLLTGIYWFAVWLGVMNASRAVGEAAGLYAGIVTLVAGLALALMVVCGLSLTFTEIVDRGSGLFEAMAASWQATSGHRFAIFAVLFVLGALYWGGQHAINHGLSSLTSEIFRATQSFRLVMYTAMVVPLAWATLVGLLVMAALTVIYRDLCGLAEG